MHQPKKIHLLVAKSVLRYLKGALYFRVLFLKINKMQNELVGWSYSDWCGDGSDRRRIIGFLFKFMGAPISWCSKKQ